MLQVQILKYGMCHMIQQIVLGISRNITNTQATGNDRSYPDLGDASSPFRKFVSIGHYNKSSLSASGFPILDTGLQISRACCIDPSPMRSIKANGDW